MPAVPAPAPSLRTSRSTSSVAATWASRLKRWNAHGAPPPACHERAYERVVTGRYGERSGGRLRRYGCRTSAAGPTPPRSRSSCSTAVTSSSVKPLPSDGT